MQHLPSTDSQSSIAQAFQDLPCFQHRDILTFLQGDTLIYNTRASTNPMANANSLSLASTSSSYDNFISYSHSEHLDIRVSSKCDYQEANRVPTSSKAVKTCFQTWQTCQSINQTMPQCNHLSHSSWSTSSPCVHSTQVPPDNEHAQTLGTQGKTSPMPQSSTKALFQHYSKSQHASVLYHSSPTYQEQGHTLQVDAKQLFINNECSTQFNLQHGNPRDPS